MAKIKTEERMTEIHVKENGFLLLELINFSTKQVSQDVKDPFIFLLECTNRRF